MITKTRTNVKVFYHLALNDVKAINKINIESGMSGNTAVDKKTTEDNKVCKEISNQLGKSFINLVMPTMQIKETLKVMTQTTTILTASNVNLTTII